MGGGGSKSTSDISNTNKQTFVTQNTIDILNKTTNEAVANALIKSNASCTSTNTISQLIDFSGCKIGGDLNITGSKQDAIITVDFSCVNVFKAEQDMAQSLLSELVNQLQSKLDTTALNNMDTTAKTSATASALSGKSDSNSKTTNVYNLASVSKNNTNIQNVVANSIQANFEVESIQNCISQAAIKQKQDYSNCEVGGNVNASELSQIAGISSAAKCVNQSGTVQKVIAKAGADMGVVISADSAIVSDNKISNAITTSATSLGLLGGGCSSCPGCDSPNGPCIYVVVIVIIIGLLLFCWFCVIP